MTKTQKRRFLTAVFLVLLVANAVFGQQQSGTVRRRAVTPPPPPPVVYVNPQDQRLVTAHASDGEAVTLLGQRDATGKVTHVTALRKGVPGSDQSDFVQFNESELPLNVFLRDGTIVTYDYSTTPATVSIRLPDGTTKTATWDIGTRPLSASSKVPTTVQAGNVVVNVTKTDCDGNDPQAVTGAQVWGSLLPNVPICSIMDFQAQELGGGAYTFTVPTELVPPSNFKEVSEKVCNDLEETLSTVCDPKGVPEGVLDALKRQGLLLTCPSFGPLAPVCVAAVEVWTGVCLASNVCANINTIAKVEDAAQAVCWSNPTLKIYVGQLGQSGYIAQATASYNADPSGVTRVAVQVKPDSKSVDKGIRTDENAFIKIPARITATRTWCSKKVDQVFYDGDIDILLTAAFDQHVAKFQRCGSTWEPFSATWKVTSATGVATYSASLSAAGDLIVVRDVTAEWGDDISYTEKGQFHSQAAWNLNNGSASAKFESSYDINRFPAVVCPPGGADQVQQEHGESTASWAGKLSPVP